MNLVRLSEDNIQELTGLPKMGRSKPGLWH